MEYDQIAEYIFAHGKRFKVPQNFPADLVRGKVGNCFDVSIMNAMRNDRFTYVEGYARHPQFQELWILHAWVTDGEHVFDPTWKQVIGGQDYPAKTDYIGIEMDRQAVLDFMIATEYKAVIANGWRDVAAAKKVIADFPFTRHAQNTVFRNV